MTLFKTYKNTVLGCLKSLKHVAEKGAAYCKEHEISEEALLTDRLFPNMLNLQSQFVIATDLARRGTQRLIGTNPPSHPDSTLIFSSLIERIDHGLPIVENINDVDFQNGPQKIELKIAGQMMSFNQESYALGFVLPNLYFHLTTTYGLLRKNGVSLGKRDYIENITKSFM